MVKSIQCFEDAAGKLHKNAFDAHRADLALWFVQSGSINDASAKKLTDRLVTMPEELDELIESLKSIRDNQPQIPVTKVYPEPPRATVEAA